METAEIISFYQNSAEELYSLFELFCNHFHSSSKNSSLYMNFISSHSNNIHALEQLRGNKNKAASMPQFVKKMLVNLPFNCQSQSPSPYFDQSLFRYDEKLISATGRHRQSSDHPIKFSSRRQQNNLKFEIKTGTFIQVNFMPPLLVLRFETDFLSGLIIKDLKLEALIVKEKKSAHFSFIQFCL